jgi:hypothetical protein
MLAVSEVVAVEDAGRGDVWNLTVESAHTFIVPGAVVSNCDALRYLVVNHQNSRGDSYHPTLRLRHGGG